MSRRNLNNKMTRLNQTNSSIKKYLTIFIAISVFCTGSGYLSTHLNNNNSNKTISESSKSNESIDYLQNTENLKVHFIDVGQADCILIQQGIYSMIIDAGNNDDAEVVKQYITSQNITKLEYVIGTHVHEDHIGSLDDVINTYDIDKVLFPKQTSTTKTFENFLLAIKNKGLKIYSPTVGEIFKLGDATFEIMAPNSNTYEDTNNYSIVIKLKYGNNSFLFTGDAESVSEKEMLNKGLDLSADVLKIGHHGSESSTTQEFLSKVNPKCAVISVGKDNSYGHPNSITMNRLKNTNIPVYRTDEQGTIVATSDCKSITFNCKPGTYKFSSNK